VSSLLAIIMLCAPRDNVQANIRFQDPSLNHHNIKLASKMYKNDNVSN
jgi:hypothetical protein